MQVTTTPATAANDAEEWVTATVGAHGFRTALTARSHTFTADEPTALGGTNAGPTPYELLLGALASCMAMTLRMYADRKRWPLEGVAVHLRSGRSHEKDCEDCETEDVGINRIERRIELRGQLSDEQRARMFAIADRCPVKQTLERTLRVVSVD